MLPPRKRTQLLISMVRPLVITTFLILAGLLVTLYLTPPMPATARTQSAEPNSNTRQGMMENTVPVSSTMPVMAMAEMGAMMDKMMAQIESVMANMPMSGTMPMSDMMSMTEMGQMMQMMGMMHQQMGQMQMMMGVMMSGDMMSGGMVDTDMGEASVIPEATRSAPEATATVEPSATAAVTESAESKAAIAPSGHPTSVLATTPQSATAGAVTVEAIPLATEELLDLAFSITLETHSVELDFDLAERATLTIGKSSFPAISWKPDATSGHHVSGTLHFTIDAPAYASLADVDEVTLDLREIDGQPVTLRFVSSDE